MSVPDPTDRRRIVVLLGMHRAGTSVTMNVLNALGVPLSDDLMPPTNFNAKGYFESLEISKVHDEILKLFGMLWSSSTITHPLPANWWRLPQVAPFKAQLTQIVSREFDKAGSLWGFKDPRTARLLPLWLEIIERTASRTEVRSGYAPSRPTWPVRSTSANASTPFTPSCSGSNTTSTPWSTRRGRSTRSSSIGAGSTIRANRRPI